MLNRSFHPGDYAPFFTKKGLVDCLRGGRRLWGFFENSTPEEFFSIFLEVQRLLASLLGRGDQELVFTESAPWITEACRKLASNLHERIPAESIASKLGVDYHSFRRIFRKVKGMAPGKYRIHRRLDRACSLLSTLNVSETAYRLGYATPYAFSAQFIRFIGQSPKEFSKAIRG